MRYFRWVQEMGGEDDATPQWVMDIQLFGLLDWGLRAGKLIRDWNHKCIRPIVTLVVAVKSKVE